MMGREVELLLVEDNENDVELTVRALRRENLCNHIQVARDGEEALDYLFSRGDFANRGDGHPRLILLDLKLPKLDGLEVLRVIKSDPHTSSIPVVMLTSSREEGDLLQSYQLGVNSYLRKPVDFDEFHVMVKQLGLYWLVVNRQPPVTEHS